MFERDNDRQGTGRLRTALAIAAVTAVVASMAIVGTVAAQPGQRFNDVPRTHYAYQSIEWAVTNQITQGCGDGRNFCPDDTLNRAQMVTFLKRYHDKFHGTTSSSSDDDDDPREYPPLRGSGTDEERITLPAGRYRVEFVLEHDRDIDDDFTAITLTAEDSDGEEEILLDRVSLTTNMTRRFRAQATYFEVGTRLGYLEPGRIYFNVTLTPLNPNDSRAPYADWEIVITER